MIFRTQFSTYEVDEPQMRVRRLTGDNEPTPYQGVDGEWRTFQEMSPVREGVGVVILWGFNPMKPAFETTQTSLVVEVDKKWGTV